jgi:uncharacterized protein YodC (DUF2158 family)
VFGGSRHRDGPQAGPDPAEFEWAPTDPATVSVGDVVYLKTGGPPMTVTAVDSGDVRVVWFASQQEKLREAKLPAKVLVSATPRDDA